LLSKQVETTDDAEDLRRFRHALAEILADRLNRSADAIVQYQKLIAADADDLDALKGLERLYDRTGSNKDYLKILDKRIEAAGSDEEKAALCRRMAAEWEAQPDGQGRAAEYLVKAAEFTGGDAETFKSLVRLYWALKDYPRLAEAYNQQIDFTPDADERAGLFAALGKVYEDHLEDPQRAIDVFNNLLSVDANSKIALGALARLYEKTAVWAQAVQILEQLATKEESVDQQVELFFRIGVIQHEQLNRPDEAEISLSKALELKDDHVGSMLGLADLYQQRKDYGKAARMLREAGRNTANELERVKRLYQSGTIYQDELDDEEKALEVFEELTALDPEHVPTGERIVLLYEKAEDLDRAEGVLDMLVRKVDAKDRARLIELNTKLGEISLACGHEEKALSAFRSAYDLDPTSQQALKDLASLLYRRKEYQEAGKLFQALLVHRRDTLEPKQIVEVFTQLGDIKQQMGERGKALNMYEKALDQDPSNVQVLERAMELYRNKGDLEAVLRCKKNMLKGTTDEEDRLTLAEEIGDMLMEELSRPNEGVTHYRMVTEARPDHRRVLNKIMEALLRQKKWDEAIVAMGKIEDYETDQSHRSRLHYTAAVIFRDKLKKPTDAAYHFDQALVKNPGNRKAFDSLKKLYRAQKNYKGLAKAYRLMLQRLPEDTPVDEQVALWNELGVICHDQLHDAKGAIVAFEVAAKLDPTDEARQERLAQLYLTAGPDAYEKAILANQRRLMTNPMRMESYKELRRLYAEIGEYDKAWCVAAVLGWLKKASAEEMALYTKHRSEHPRRVARKLSDDLWRDHLYHPSQTPILNDVFAMAAPLVAPMLARSSKEMGLKSGDQLDLDLETRVYAKSADYVGQVLDNSVSAMYIRGTMDRDRQLIPVLMGSTEEFSTVLLINPKILQNDSLIELNYWFCKAMAMLRLEHTVLYGSASATVLRAVALAFLKVVRPATKLTGEVEQINRLVNVFKTDLPPNKLDLLAERADQLLEATSEKGINDWIEGVNQSATRAALLLCDDLETAARLISTEQDGTAADHSASVKLRLRQLMIFAVSNHYFKLRELLGLQIH
jgi:tetratricopeptide (TPR) repeat protein